MKTIKNHLKTIAVFLSILLLMQGCVIYKGKPSTIDEAVNANTEVRIETKNAQTIKFKRIEFKNGQYYGINKPHKAIIKTPIKVELVKSVKIKDRIMSTIVPIIIPLMIIFAYGISPSGKLGGWLD